MNPPLKTLAALALALAAGSPALAGGDTPIPMGPPAPGQCVIGAAGCGGDAMAESAQASMAADQAKAQEKAMLANGTYLSLTQTKDGAIFELAETDKDGKHLWSRSDYAQGLCFLPHTLDQLAQDASLPPALHAAALEAQKKEKADADKVAAKQQECSSLNPGADCAKGNSKPNTKGRNTLSALDFNPTGAGTGLTDASTPVGEDAGGTPVTDASGDGNPTNLAQVGAGIGNGFGDTAGAPQPNGKGGTPTPDQTAFNQQSQAAIAEINAGVMAGAKIDPGTFGFVNTRKAAASPTVGLLQKGGFTPTPMQDPVTVRVGNTNEFGTGGSGQ
jgi:hypothetical protein